MAKISINLKKGNIQKQEDVIIGIDLGTTNSLVAYVPAEGKPARAIKDQEGKNTLVPSIVHFDQTGSIVVGDEAKNKLEINPERTIYSVKRLMGKSYDDVASFQKLLGYRIVNEDTEALVKIEVDGKYHTPVTLSAEILKHLKARIENNLGQVVNKAVITVPAYFNDSQRQATRDAGKLAGLDVLRIVNEPTAAALAYGIGLDASEEKKVVVYDLGGGTFDVSILEIQHGIFDVISTHGDTFLGGDDFDHAIIEHWMTANNWDTVLLEEDKGFSQSIRLLAEKAKKALSKKDSFSAELKGTQISIRKQDFESMIRPIVERTIESCKKAMKDAGLAPKAIDEVIMVGGSTRVPMVHDMVQAFFEKDLNTSQNPDEVVALGAAVQAAVLAGKQKGVLLLDITPLSLGIETMGGLMDVIISRNSKIPTALARSYTTSIDGQKNLKISVFQGERDLVDHNRKLGEFILQGIPPMPAGIPKIEVQFMLDADGILVVKAKELRSGIEQQITIKSQYGISEAEMAKMLLDSIQNAKYDMEIKALLEAKNEAQNVIVNTDRFVKQHKSWLSEEQISSIVRLLDELKSSSKGEDKDAINQAMTSLNDYATPLAHEAMDKVIQESLSGQDINSTKVD